MANNITSRPSPHPLTSLILSNHKIGILPTRPRQKIPRVLRSMEPNLNSRRNSDIAEQKRRIGPHAIRRQRPGAEDDIRLDGPEVHQFRC